MHPKNNPVGATESNAPVAHCRYCGKLFTPRSTGGKAQQFCSEEHRLEWTKSVRRSIGEWIKFGVIVMVDGRWAFNLTRYEERYKTYESFQIENASADEASPDNSSKNINSDCSGTLR